MGQASQRKIIYTAVIYHSALKLKTMWTIAYDNQIGFIKTKRPHEKYTYLIKGLSARSLLFF